MTHRIEDTGTFGRRVFQARLALSARLGRTVSQTEVGSLMGVTGVTVGNWEAGKNEPPLETIQRLAQVLGVTPELLAFGAPVVAPPLEEDSDLPLHPGDEEERREGGGSGGGRGTIG